MARFFWLVLALAGCAPTRESASDDAGRLQDAAFLNQMFGLPAAAGPYFPPSDAQASIVCDYGRGNRRFAIVDEFQSRWFSQHLAAAGEPSLYLESQRQRDPSALTLRFTWLRTFHAPVIVRIEAAEGSYRLIARQLSGAGGYSPGQVSQRIDRQLTAHEASRLRTLLSRNHFFDLPGAHCEMGTDGALWIFERADQAGYRVLTRWTPAYGPAHEVGLFLLGLTGWRFEIVY